MAGAEFQRLRRGQRAELGPVKKINVTHYPEKVLELTRKQWKFRRTAVITLLYISTLRLTASATPAEGLKARPAWQRRGSALYDR